MISFVLTWWIINEFEKYFFSYTTTEQAFAAVNENLSCKT